ncbi:MAG: hypothetical protein QOC99_1300 [Acidobacteriota bacterium]|nr:hypothetical protein [Acidobacteriota bacterium]
MLERILRSRSVLRLLALVFGAVAACVLTAGWRWAHAPRAWRPGEVPVAFWAWRAETPSQADVESAARETGARCLFLRAGQMDFASGRVVRVRAVSGPMPRGVELQLVYNATPQLLAEFGKVDEKALADALVETFRADSERAARDGAWVSGLQLDIDVPTRLLARYAYVLRAARAGLPSGAKLSVTGLPTWIGAAGLRDVLDAVDFWSPQFYGAEIPATADRVIPNAAPLEVARAVERVRALEKPFYAGLAAYGYALLYDERGRLLELRGDIDPARVASDGNFELVERRAFGGSVEGDGATSGVGRLAGEWRYVFRARGDTVLAGLSVRAGEQIVLDVPGSESLRAGVRGVREGAGEKLLGICFFRLPTQGDSTALGLTQVSAALRDREAESSTRVSAEAFAADAFNAEAFTVEASAEEASTKRVSHQPVEKVSNQPIEKVSNQLLITADNDGASGAVYGDGALTVTLRVARGSVRGVTRLEGFDKFETLCETFEGAGGNGARSGAGQSDAMGDKTERDDSTQNDAGRDGQSQMALRPCSAARAVVVRLGARAWPMGARARAGLSFEGDLPARIPAAVAVVRDDGRVWERLESLSTKAAEAR